MIVPASTLRTFHCHHFYFILFFTICQGEDRHHSEFSLKCHCFDRILWVLTEAELKLKSFKHKRTVGMKTTQYSFTVWWTDLCVHWLLPVLFRNLSKQRPTGRGETLASASWGGSSSSRSESDTHTWKYNKISHTETLRTSRLQLWICCTPA